MPHRNTGKKKHVPKKTYKFRAYPNREQEAALQAQLTEACQLYNAALLERKLAWEMQRKSIIHNFQFHYRS